MRTARVLSTSVVYFLALAIPLLATERSFRVDRIQEASIADIHLAMEHCRPPKTTPPPQ